jgi:hypothetical protein
LPRKTVECNEVIADGVIRLPAPGAYGYVLEHKCAVDAMKAAPDYLTLPDSEVEAWGRANDERKAALVAERDGQPLRVQSWLLPPDLPAPFDNFPVGGRRGSFVVYPADTIEFVPKEIR